MLEIKRRALCRLGKHFTNRTKSKMICRNGAPQSLNQNETDLYFSKVKDNQVIFIKSLVLRKCSHLFRKQILASERVHRRSRKCHTKQTAVISGGRGVPTFLGVFLLSGSSESLGGVRRGKVEHPAVRTGVSGIFTDARAACQR